MRQRLKNVLTLLDNDSIEQLIYQFLEVNHRRPHFDALLVALLNVNEGRLESYRFLPDDRRSSPQLDVDIGDINHPLVQVLRNGVPMTWRSLNRGVRLENREYLAFLQALPNDCGLYAIPLFSSSGQAYGVVAVFAESLDRFTPENGMFSIYCHVLQHRLIKLQEYDYLRRQLGQIREVFKTQQQRQKQLDELLLSLSTADTGAVAGLSQDYSKIDNLEQALEEYEYAILMQRHRIYGEDKKNMAASLGISPRSLTYKLAKYRYLT